MASAPCSFRNPDPLPGFPAAFLPRRARPAPTVTLTLALVLALTLAGPIGAGQGAALAQSRLEAQYEARLSGLKLGQGSWVVDAGESEFSESVKGMTAGLARIFGRGEGTGEVRGVVNGEGFSTQSYVASLTTGRGTEEVRIVMKAGSVKELDIRPPLPPASRRIPVTDAHKRNVFDPMSAALLRVPGNGDLLAPENCQRHVAIFDGRLRFDLSFAFKRKERLSVKGYDGEALVCSVTFVPLAGHQPDRLAFKYLAAQRDIEVSLAPIAGTRVLAPVRLSVPTPLGRGELAATQFIAAPLPKPVSKSQ